MLEFNACLYGWLLFFVSPTQVWALVYSCRKSCSLWCLFAASTKFHVWSWYPDSCYLWYVCLSKILACFSNYCFTSCVRKLNIERADTWKVSKLSKWDWKSLLVLPSFSPLANLGCFFFLRRSFLWCKCWELWCWDKGVRAHPDTAAKWPEKPDYRAGIEEGVQL